MNNEKTLLICTASVKSSKKRKMFDFDEGEKFENVSDLYRKLSSMYEILADQTMAVAVILRIVGNLFEGLKKKYTFSNN